MMTYTLARNNAFSLFSVFADFCKFFNHSACPHISSKPFETGIPKIVSSQHFKTQFNFEKLPIMNELLTFEWVTLITGHPCSCLLRPQWSSDWGAALEKESDVLGVYTVSRSPAGVEITMHHAWQCYQQLRWCCWCRSKAWCLWRSEPLQQCTVLV